MASLVSLVSKRALGGSSLFVRSVACAAQCQVTVPPESAAFFAQQPGLLAAFHASKPSSPTSSTVTYVRKITHSGDECRTCAQVSKKLQQDGLESAVDRVVVLDERDPSSEGFALAATFKQNSAPFFIVQQESGAKVLTMYSQLKKVLLTKNASDHQPSPFVPSSSPASSASSSSSSSSSSASQGRMSSRAFPAATSTTPTDLANFFD